MKTAEVELREIAARQRATALECLFALVVGLALLILAPAAEAGSNELQGVYLGAVAGFGIGLVTTVQRLLELCDTSCPRCNEPFYAFPRLPVLLPRRCASCAQSLACSRGTSDGRAA